MPNPLHSTAWTVSIADGPQWSKRGRTRHTLWQLLVTAPICRGLFTEFHVGKSETTSLSAFGWRCVWDTDSNAVELFGQLLDIMWRNARLRYQRVPVPLKRHRVILLCAAFSLLALMTSLQGADLQRKAKSETLCLRHWKAGLVDAACSVNESTSQRVTQEATQVRSSQMQKKT